MKLIKDKDKNQRLGHRFGVAAASALVMGLVSFAFVGELGLAWSIDGQSGSGGTSPPGTGGFSAGEELVGTLPTRESDEPPFTPPDLPGFYIQGPFSNVLDTLQSAEGPGNAVIELIEGPGTGLGSEQIIKLSFEGPVIIHLDAAFLSNPAMSAGIVSTSQFSCTHTLALTEHAILLRDLIPAEGSVVLPMREFAVTGALNEGLHLLTRNREFGFDQMNIDAVGGLIVVSQGIQLGE